MGIAQSKDKMYCTRYVNGGPPTLADQVDGDIRGTYGHKREPGIAEGSQPHGKMACTVLRRSVEGYPDCDTIQISFVFEEGVQSEKHPNPGQKYQGLCVEAYLPQNSQGTKVLKLLEKAFNYNLLFAVTTNSLGEDAVTLSDIPLKTSDKGGIESNGYPDPKYLKTVKKILKDKGIK